MPIVINQRITRISLSVESGIFDVTALLTDLTDHKAETPKQANERIRREVYGANQDGEGPHRAAQRG